MIIFNAAEYITNLFEKSLSPDIEFHTIDHTKYVADGTEIIGNKSGLTGDDLIIALLSAWFHDAGYAIHPENHEEESANIAEEFLKSKNIDQQNIEKVKKAILATAIPQSPINLISKVLCDADLMHLFTLKLPTILYAFLNKISNWYNGSIRLPKYQKLEQTS